MKVFYEKLKNQAKTADFDFVLNRIVKAKKKKVDYNKIRKKKKEDSKYEIHRI